MNAFLKNGLGLLSVSFLLLSSSTFAGNKYSVPCVQVDACGVKGQCGTAPKLKGGCAMVVPAKIPATCGNKNLKVSTCMEGQVSFNNRVAYCSDEFMSKARTGQLINGQCKW